jgi:hypothetical protein
MGSDGRVGVGVEGEGRVFVDGVGKAGGCGGSGKERLSDD